MGAERRRESGPAPIRGRTGARAGGWTTQQLAEFVGVISGRDDYGTTVQMAIERVAEVTESEAGAIITADGLATSIGFGAEGAPVQELREVADGRRDALAIPGIGACHAISVPLSEEALDHLVLIRFETPFDREESNLLRAAMRVLTLTLRQIETKAAEMEHREVSEQRGEENERLVESLRERHRLFERLSRIQSSIVSRLAIDDVLQGIVDGAAELLGDQTVALRLVDRDDPTKTTIAAAHGITDEALAGGRHGLVGEGAGGRAISEERLVVIEGYGDDPTALEHWRSYGVRSAMATPVRERGKVVGSLVVARDAENHAYSAAEREILVAFAKHASIALTDARTVEDAIDQALHDPLTGLPNRTLLTDRLKQALARAESSGALVAVLFCDLDQFKTVNDSLGHAAGDELLVAVGRRLLGCVRPGDTAARFGGDEFAVLIEDAAQVDLTVISDRILQALEEPFAVRDKEVFLSGSIGIATGASRDDDLLRNADLAMYRAKRSGSGRHETFAPHMHASVVERQELEAELKRAIMAEQLEVHYQPIIELMTNRLAGVEALVRWSHPERGVLGPAEFIPIAEETGAILSLGRAVLMEACETVAGWQRAHPAAMPLSLSVNVSVVQLDGPALVTEVREALLESGLAPGTLTLELTETAFSREPEQLAMRLQELNDLDVELAIDDFGTGFSSLQHLQSYPIDMLKIPKVFIDGVGGQGDDSALTRAIVDIGESLGLRVVAEGIERPEQVLRLRELGCRYGQGYLIDRPMRAEALEEALARKSAAASRSGAGAA